LTVRLERMGASFYRESAWLLDTGPMTTASLLRSGRLTRSRGPNLRIDT
jgi:hypothetical protein